MAVATARKAALAKRRKNSLGVASASEGASLKRRQQHGGSGGNVAWRNQWHRNGGVNNHVAQSAGGDVSGVIGIQRKSEMAWQPASEAMAKHHGPSAAK